MVSCKHFVEYSVLKSLDLTTVKKYIDQELPYLMRQICVLQWEEIKKKRIQGQRIIFEGKGPKGWNKNMLLLYFSC